VSSKKRNHKFLAKLGSAGVPPAPLSIQISWLMLTGMRAGHPRSQ
jgi:hypothetical protein